MAEKHVVFDGTETKHDRFLDVDQEPRRMLQPIEEYQKMPLVSLDKAVEPILFCCPDIQRRAFIAMSNCENPIDGLDQNESAAIFLYTMEWNPRDECLYYVLNKILRTENRQKLKPWYSYLKLIITALQKLPSQQLTVWRGVTHDLSQQYEIGKRYVWWAFSSCTRSLAVLESNLFLGRNGPRTLFNIECHNGKKIRSHSYIQIEDEILLLPATQFEVISKLEPSSDLHIIHLKQVDPPFPLIELPLITMTTQPTSDTKHNKTISPNNNYRNDKLEQLIAQCTLNGAVELKDLGLTDNDIPIIVHQAIIDKQCSYLNLSSNMITCQGIQYLTEHLQSNTSLAMLRLETNQITDDSAHWIAQMLHINTRLTYLGLYNNQISDEGSQFLAEALQTNSTLEVLLLDSNLIGDSGVWHIAQALITNTTLQTLVLGGGKITDHGTISLAEMLKQNRTLTYLDLDYNPLTNNGAKIIFDALCHNNSLRQLDIRCSQMTGKCVKDIENMLKQNNTLIELNIFRKCFTIQEQDQLQTIAKTKQNCQICFH